MLSPKDRFREGATPKLAADVTPFTPTNCRRQDLNLHEVTPTSS